MVFFSTNMMGLFMACSIPGEIAENGEAGPLTGNHTIILVQNPVSLLDILVQVPRVAVSRDLNNTFITIRGGIPLCVVDGIRIGKSYERAVEIVNIFDIETMEIIKGISESAIYGPGHCHGVILIHTKGTNEIEG